MKKISRREFFQKSSCALAAAALPSIGQNFPYLRNPKMMRKAIVLGMDGLDPKLVRRFVDAGEMPTFKRCMQQGYFGELRTSNPPQSPVAWASFITGTNPGGHGIFDFVHRDAASFTPYMSTSRSFDAGSSISLGKWKIPLGSGAVNLMRRGKPFWATLEEQGIPATIFQIPANFPAQANGSRIISGMGTPDLLGTYGTFTLFSDQPVAGSENFAGGRVVLVNASSNRIETELTGPRNSLRSDKVFSAVPLRVYRDPERPQLLIELGNTRLVLKQGEWSDWIPLRLGLMPLVADIPGMVRFYAKEVRPGFKLYCSPINADPLDPALPLSSPPEFSREVAQDIGRFHTQGFPADNKGLSTGVLSDDEYLHQAKLVQEESMRAFQHQLERFEEGLFFFYFSSTDQNQHMLWRLMDESHPLYKTDASKEVKDGVLYFYRQMDQVLKMALTKVDSSTLLMALSDHGFAPFTREFNLSTWLVEQGFTVLTNKKKAEDAEFYRYVDWKRSKAYALGINGIYLNLAGREKFGSVSAQEAPALRQAIINALLQVSDPLSGKRVVLNAYDGTKIYSGEHMALAPDVVVGYDSGFRISDEAVLGRFPREIVRNRTDAWAADHCLDPSTVPGMLLCNRGLQASDPALWDMAPSLLSGFGIAKPAAMEGRQLIDY
jgi:predicted AlkP superfamily phosphohydrolase/phosphomutase